LPRLNRRRATATEHLGRSPTEGSKYQRDRGGEDQKGGTLVQTETLRRRYRRKRLGEVGEQANESLVEGNELLGWGLQR
jgi:hypothetical protein